MIVGVTGPFASGKSVLASYFRKRGFRLIDVDSVGHTVLERRSIRSGLHKAFGPRIFLSNGSVNRGLLAGLVFGYPVLLKKLNRIVHPALRAEVIRQAARSGNSRVIVDAALLFELKLDKICDRIILVTASKETILERGMKRNRFDPATIRGILKSQLPAAVKKKRSDIVISNDSNFDSYKRKITEVYGSLSRRR